VKVGVTALLTERVVVITGAAGGIGTALVDRFLLNGDTVIATDLEETRLSAMLSTRLGTKLTTVEADLTNEQHCVDLASVAHNKAGRVDVLINCAGYFPIRPFEEITLDEWRRVIDINLTGVFLTTRSILPLIKGRNWGRIINIGSGSFFKGTPNQSHYVAAKAGVVGLSRSLASELGPHGITVNVVTPGLTSTDAVLQTMPAELLEARRLQRSIRRHQYADDLLGAVFFLASPGADFITGQIMNVDGGSVMH
jgi:NAD(P)-dependent dehydrogenase (short-subunit alcohol dehydrogenase family)